VSLEPGFVWGAATAAFQIEGALDEDGRGASIWDRFPVRAGDTGAVACDFYHRWREDVDLMRELGLDAFRFSVAWPRVLPEGRGRVNERGLDFYDRLVDALLEAGIQPWATLYHWDLPQALEDAGGWPERATAEAFAAYAEVVARRLGDRVSGWITHNEPFIVAWLGYGNGEHAPGRADPAAAVAAGHHVLLSHALALDVLRREAPQAAHGITLDVWPCSPATGSEADADAAARHDAWRNRWFLDPLFGRGYPFEGAPVRDGDLAAIAAPLDFLGINTYSRALVAAGPGGEPRLVRAPDGELTDTGWEVWPDALHDVLARVHADYAPPALYVTENGAAFADVRGHDGAVHDPERVEYLRRYTAAVARAAAAGIPVRGYFVWSLVDNFEWAHGYSKRFGLVYVDYPTLERVPKDSFAWYRSHIAARRGAPAHV
jgi:beta-glucosidase